MRFRVVSGSIRWEVPGAWRYLLGPLDLQLTLVVEATKKGVEMQKVVVGTEKSIVMQAEEQVAGFGMDRALDETSGRLAIEPAEPSWEF